MDYTEEEVASLIAWAEHQDLVRAMLLTSSRAIPGAPVDRYSDYDVILALRDVHPFHDSRAWLEDFGAVLALYRDPLQIQDGFLKGGYVIQFESGLKIDFSLWPVEFFLEATYVAKYLWRDDVMAAKFILDNFMKHEHLRPMLEWHYEIDRNWSVKPGLYGRRMKLWLRHDLWLDLEGSYTGAGREENWVALFKTIALMRKTATEVGDRLGFSYPHDLERRSMAYLQAILTSQK